MSDAAEAKLTAEEVADWMDNGTGFDDPHLALVVPATIAYVDSLPSIERTTDGGWAATTKLGATMLAARLWQRKNSQAGITAVGDVSTYVPRYDSDIARLLRIDTFTALTVG